ncbi:MAG: UDP-N-acetylmuramoyl-L-alanine--D-glutamate ligase [Planctomycetes bacterium]|nr:UDP-N-acetylmuramoyl-L-alanine--D-glutamate ligase [Planctomycetota bacterium]
MKATVMGLGLFGGGVGATRDFARRGFNVTVTDLRPKHELRESIKKLQGIPNIKYILGRHRNEDFINTELVVVNPAVPHDSPFLKLARRHNVPVTTEMNRFLQECPAPIIGVTGSNGKTTTTALLGEMLKSPLSRGDLGVCGLTHPVCFAATPLKRGLHTTSKVCAIPRIWVGGNIGGESLLERVDHINKDDLVVLELSSFHLEYIRSVPPALTVSVVTNISPNHLDRHKTMAEYINAKKNIIRYQKPGGWTVLNLDDAEVRRWSGITRGDVLYFSRRRKVRNGAFIKDNKFCIADNGRVSQICPVSDTKLLGTFNTENILAALAATIPFNVKPYHLRKVIRGFRGVEHRLEFVGSIKGVKYYNDSIATNPVSTIGALRAVPGIIHLIAGGYDKKIPLNDLAREIIRLRDKVKSVILIGVTAPKIARLLPASLVTRCKTLREAVLTARRRAKRGETVLLSPACASFDMFRNFAERGQEFKKIVRFLYKETMKPGKK